MYLKKNSSGFTLTELVVVITIIAILGTLGFISYNELTGNSRDTKRLQDITALYTGLKTLKAKSVTYPLPTGSVTITNS